MNRYVFGDSAMVDKLCIFALEKGVKELDISLGTKSGVVGYYLPPG